MYNRISSKFSGASEDNKVGCGTLIRTLKQDSGKKNRIDRPPQPGSAASTLDVAMGCRSESGMEQEPLSPHTVVGGGGN